MFIGAFVIQGHLVAAVVLKFSQQAHVNYGQLRSFQYNRYDGQSNSLA